MDIRKTLAIDETFLTMLTDCKARNAKTEMILDVNGLERTEGLIKELNAENPEPYLVLEGGVIVILKSIIALNGVFLPAYSEC